MSEEMRPEDIREAVRTAAEELLAAAKAKEGQIFVVGCSSSEIVGGRIGHNSVPDVGKAVFDGVCDAAKKYGVYVAAQCCEHLNRALIVESECAEKYGLDPVTVRPQPKAGGSFATAAYDGMKSPVAVESIRAHVGMDIGGTLIGMHLRAVAVPVRLSVDRIGSAILLCARTRPKYIGGSRAVYPTDER